MFKIGKRSTKGNDPAPVAELTPQQLIQLRTQREKVDIQAEEDIDALRITCLNLLSQRDSAQNQVAEVKQQLHTAEVRNVPCVICNDISTASLLYPKFSRSELVDRKVCK